MQNREPTRPTQPTSVRRIVRVVSTEVPDCPTLISIARNRPRASRSGCRSTSITTG